MSESLGVYLRRLRGSRRLDQQSLATRLGIGAPYLSRLERGRTPYLSDELVSRLGDALSLTEAERQRLANLRDVSAGRVRLSPGTSHEAVELIKLMIEVAPDMSDAQVAALRESVRGMLRLIELTEDREMTVQK